MSTKLYEEAIAEAKQLRELAEQNAKNAIIEAVTPKIKSFIEDQLLGNNTSHDDGTSIMDDVVSEITGGSDEDIELSESEIGALMGLVSESSQKQALHGLINKVARTTGEEDKMANNNQGDYLEIDLDDNLLNEGAGGDDADTSEYSLEEIVAMLEGDDDDTDDDASDDDASDEGHSDKSLEELAEAILRMELDLGDDVELPEEWSGDVSVEMADEEEGEDMEAPAGEDMEAPEGEDLEAPEAGEGEEEGGSLDDLLEKDGRTITIREADFRNEIRKIKAAMEQKADKRLERLNEKWKQTLASKLSKSNISENSTNEDRDNRVLRGQLAEYRRATKSLRKQLTEMNLFNAKLLYVNKLLQNKGVTTGQRRSIIESIDKAKSLREVQLLYKSLTGSISKSKTLSESTVRKTLGSSSRVTRGASPRRTASTEVDRWATLAGLSED